MNYDHFGDYVNSLSRYDQRMALTIRRFIKIERLTYQQLQLRAYQTAHYLNDQGVKSGDRIMVVAGNSPQWIELLLGTQLIGAILVPVDASSTLKTAQRFIKETNPTLIFRNEALHPELNGQFKTRVLEQLDTDISNYSHDPPKVRLHGDDPALIVFTSGTTADPKGVVLTQKNILTNITGIQKRIAIQADWRLLSVLPLSHMYELTGSLAVLSRGASIYYMPRVTPVAIARALQDYKITTMLAIPQLLILLLERIKQTAAEDGKARVLAIAFKIGAHLPFPMRRVLFHSVHARLGGHLALVVTGGAPIPLDVASYWESMGIRMVQGYGLTETSPILAVNGLMNRRLDSPGQILSGVDVRIADDGEIQAKGPNIFKEYWHNSIATNAAFTKDGWFKTGDTGNLQNGWLHIKGRLKFAIVRSSGLKVFPEDIELVAAKLPILKSFCVVGVNNPRGELVMAVVISDKSDSDIEKAIHDINNQIESFQHIDEWKRWPDADFPRTRLLKVDRRQVQLWANAKKESQHQENSDTKIKEDLLLTIIRTSLDKPSTDLHDTDLLADVGLDSLRRLNVVALIESQLGVTVPEEKVLASSTIANLRKLVAQGNQAAVSSKRSIWQFKPWIRVIGNCVRQLVLRPILRIWVKIRVEGIDELDNLKSPALFIFNHADDFDAPVVYQALPSRIRNHLSVAAAEDVMRNHWVLSLITRLCFAGFYFSRHEPYLPSLEYVGQMIDKGWNVVIAPEGRISTIDGLRPFKSGIGLLAVNLGVPVVPVKTIGLRGTVPLHAKWPKKHSKVVVRIGKPIYFDASSDYDKATATLYRIMNEL